MGSVIFNGERRYGKRVARTYGQYCGLAKALELVGERWALLIIRDLLIGPRRFTDLRNGNPRIPTNVLATRLRELEDAGLIERRLLPRPHNTFVYELTEYGRDIEPALHALGRWGVRSLGQPEEGDVITADSLTTALRSTFTPSAHRGHGRIQYQLRVGPVVLTATVRRTSLTVTTEAEPEPDVIIEAGPAIKAIMAGELNPADAIAEGLVVVTGDPALLELFARTFPVGPPPAGPSVPAQAHR
jgi:DNA-binding HxlR family transcriptional regulator